MSERESAMGCVIIIIIYNKNRRIYTQIYGGIIYIERYIFNNGGPVITTARHSVPTYIYNTEGKKSLGLFLSFFIRSSKNS